MDPDPKVRPDPEQLAAVPLFDSLSHEQLQVVAGLTSVRRAESGRRLVGQGTPGYLGVALRPLRAGVRFLVTPIRRYGTGAPNSAIAAATIASSRAWWAPRQ